MNTRGMKSEIKLIVSQYENDRLMDVINPLIEKVFKEQLPEVTIEYITSLEEKRPTYRGVRDWLIMFEVEWIYAPSDLVKFFKNYL